MAEELIERAVQALGVGIGSAVTLLDVEAVVIGGGLGERLGPDWLTRIEAAAREHTFFKDRPRTGWPSSATSGARSGRACSSETDRTRAGC